MRHFNLQNRHEIKDAKPGTWATVFFSDFETLSELSRRGFYLVEMRSEVWTMRRVGDEGAFAAVSVTIEGKSLRNRLRPPLTATA